MRTPLQDHARNATRSPPAGAVPRQPEQHRPENRRPESEFADQLPVLRRFAALPVGDPERERLREQLIIKFLPVGERVASRQAGGSPWARDDLRQVASEAVVRAVDRWDPERATGDFLTYLVPCIRGELMHWFRDHTWSMRVPRRIKDLSVSIRHATPILAQQLNRAPRPSELARHLEVDTAEVLEALQAEENHHAAALDPPGVEDETTPGATLGGPDEHLGLVDDLTTLRPLLDRLPPRERRILLLRFYGGRTQTQIGEEIGISQMHVSRLLAQTLAKLRAEMLRDGPAASS